MKQIDKMMHGNREKKELRAQKELQEAMQKAAKYPPAQ